MAIISEQGRRTAAKAGSILFSALAIGLLSAIIPGTWFFGLGIVLAIVLSFGLATLCILVPSLRRDPVIILALCFWWAITLWWLYDSLTHR